MAVIVLIAAIAAGAAVLVTRAGDDAGDQAAVSDPATVELPAEPDDGSDARTYLEGDGQAVVDFARDVPILRGTGAPPTAEACAAARSDLSAIGSPKELALLSEGIPDPATSDMASSYLGASLAYIDGCVRGDAPDRTDLAFTSEVLRRRLEQLGVR